jgi:predicted transcriptional regulator
LRFTPIISRDDYTDQYLTDAKDTFFSGSPTSLISFFVRRQHLRDEEIDELLNIIKERRHL